MVILIHLLYAKLREEFEIKIFNEKSEVMNEEDNLKEKIARTNLERNEEYYHFGKKIYEILGEEVSKINELVDKLIEYKIKF